MMRESFLIFATRREGRVEVVVVVWRKREVVSLGWEKVSGSAAGSMW